MTERPDTLLTLDRSDPHWQRARRYSRFRFGLGMASTIASTAAVAAFALSGKSASLRTTIRSRTPNDALATAAFAGAAAAAGWALSLPTGWLLGHKVEKRFGLTRQSTAGWLTDQAKGLAVTEALIPPLAAGAYGVIRRRPDDWWLWLAGISVPVSVGLAQLAPVVLMPIFNRFDPFDDEELVARIDDLAARSGVTISAVFRMDMSRQSEKPNAFFTGLGRTKRIVLGDTLVDRFHPRETEGVIAHELGHQAHGDIWKLVGIGAIQAAGTLWAVQRISERVIPGTAARTGVGEVADEASIPIMLLVASGVGLVTGPVTAAISRAIERRTDRYAVDLTGDREAYASAMVRLGKLALADPWPPRLAVWLGASHPPLGERVDRAMGGHPPEKTGS